MMDLSCENNERLKVIKYFGKKTPPQMFDFEIKSTVNTLNKKLVKPAFCFLLIRTDVNNINVN